MRLLKSCRAYVAHWTLCCCHAGAPRSLTCVVGEENALGMLSTGRWPACKHKMVCSCLLSMLCCHTGAPRSLSIIAGEEGAGGCTFRSQDCSRTAQQIWPIERSFIVMQARRAA